MAHARKQIRDAAVALLTGLTTTGARVFPSRTLPLAPAQRPGLCIYTTREESEETSMGPNPTVRHFLDLVVVGLVDVTDATADLDDRLDLIAAEVETAIGGDPTLGGRAKDLMLTESEQSLSGEGATEQGVLKLTFELEYQTKRLDPNVIV